MMNDRSRILSATDELDCDDHDHGEDNPTFSNDNIPFDSKLRTQTNTDDINVSFSNQNSTININYRSTTNETFVQDDNVHVSDEEVAANVSNSDDTAMFVLTFRSWFLGILFTCLLSFVNQFFWYRTSPLFVGTLVAQLLTFPLGKLMATMLPCRKFRCFHWQFTLNPGPFTVKEHCIITAMANATCVRSFSIANTLDTKR
jgi:hypothetical protein